MAIKTLKLDSPLYGLTPTYVVVTRDSDGYFLANSGSFVSTTPVFPNLTEDSSVKGRYTYLSSTVWTNGSYHARFYYQIGGSQSLTTDNLIGVGSTFISDDAEVSMESLLLTIPADVWSYISRTLTAPSNFVACQASASVDYYGNFVVNTWANSNGTNIQNPTSCQIFVYNQDGSLYWNPPISTTFDSNGVFRFTKIPAGFTVSTTFYISITIVQGLNTFVNVQSISTTIASNNIITFHGVGV